MFLCIGEQRLAKIGVEHTGEIRMGWNDPSISFQVSRPSQYSIQSAVKEYFKHQPLNLRRNKPSKWEAEMWKYDPEKYIK